jgi:hypothetical protein
MIRKTKLFYVGAVFAASVSLTLLSACSGSNSAENYIKSDAESVMTESDNYSNKYAGSVWDSRLIDESRFKLNIKLTRDEERWARKNARSLATHLKQGSAFVHYLLVELDKKDLPVELMAIPLIESGLNPHVKSSAGAHGPWQFMRSTGKSLGLKRTGNYDELYDFIATTEVSLDYLKYLYNELDHNWDMVAAAYNQGEFGVKKAIRQAKARGVKDLNVNTVKLTQSAKTYIKRFHAYAALLRNPEKFNLDLPEIQNRPAFKRIEVAGRINSMKKVAELSGTDLKTLKKLNAGFLTDSLKTPDGHDVLVPTEKAYALERALDDKKMAN